MNAMTPRRMKNLIKRQQDMILDEIRLFPNHKNSIDSLLAYIERLRGDLPNHKIEGIPYPKELLNRIIIPSLPSYDSKNNNTQYLKMILAEQSGILNYIQPLTDIQNDYILKLEAIIDKYWVIRERLRNPEIYGN